GNGMGMAIRSAQLASELIIDYFNGRITKREELELLYKRSWNRNFSLRLRVGHTIAYMFRNDWLAPKLLTVLRWFPFLLPKIIRLTHGKPMIV
ncbi:MAG: FAD-dependent oxidoreductase, partial [Bacteroidia bacterium]|nr:FAD-dependent oxidoreductase [Bacteroidia bacterium]